MTPLTWRTVTFTFWLSQPGNRIILQFNHLTISTWQPNHPPSVITSVFPSPTPHSMPDELSATKWLPFITRGWGGAWGYLIWVLRWEALYHCETSPLLFILLVIVTGIMGGAPGAPGSHATSASSLATPAELSDEAQPVAAWPCFSVFNFPI